MKILVLSPAIEGIKNVIRDLLYGCWCRGKRIGGAQMPPLNLLSVATVLKESGHEVEFVDAGIDYDSYEKVQKRLINFGAVVLLSSTHSFGMDMETLRELKELNSNIKTIIFGSHPTFMPRYCLKEDCVDFIVRKEPEFIIRDLVDALDKKRSWKKIKGIGYKKNKKLVLNGPYPLIKDLDELPIPKRSFLSKSISYFNPLIKRAPYTTLQTSRGCPGKCNFCTVPYFYGHKFRAQSAERVIRELKEIETKGYKEAFFRDETFTAFPKRNEEICLKMIKEGIDLTWVCNSRVDTVSIEMMRLMKKAGCHMIKFGVESGVQKILSNINKGTTLEQTKKAFGWAREVGIDCHAHVMLGCPGETRETLRKTIDFVKEINPTTATFGIHTPYPGSKLFDDVAKFHPEIKDGSACDLTKIHTTGFFNESFTSLNIDELEKGVRRSYRNFYLRPNYLLGWFKKLMSLEEFRRVVKAGVAIFDFSLRGDN